MPPDGFLNLLKPPGMTSHDVVAFARSRLRLPRAGHLGTLDPVAAGVLPLAFGRATRLSSYAAGRQKVYRAEVIFGIETITLDAKGDVTAVADSSALTRARLCQLLAGFVGEIEQVPPLYSAVHHQGRRLHEWARRGQAPATGSRKVRILSLDLVAFWPGPRARAMVDVVCEAGTYVRALAFDLGRAAGCGAYLSFLLRIRAGRFELPDSLTLEECHLAFERGELPRLVLPVDWPLEHLACAELDETDSRRFRQGTLVAVRGEAEGPVRVYSPGQRFLGIGAQRQGRLRPRVVISGPE